MRFIKTSIAAAALLAAAAPASAEYVAMEKYLSKDALQFVYPKTFGLVQADQSTAWAYQLMEQNPGACDDDLWTLIDEATSGLQRNELILTQQYSNEPHGQEVQRYIKLAFENIKRDFFEKGPC